MTILILVIIIESILLLLFVSKTFIHKYSGRLIIDEAADSWSISITDDPEIIKKYKYLRLKIELIK